MQDILVSIIIPVYKVEPYILRCVESVLNQTYRHLEVILVDDCSPDQSMELVINHIQNLEKTKGVAFKLCKHDVNQGLSAARNTGMKVASGDYVYFLDSDDEIVPTCIELLVKGSEHGSYDVINGDFETVGSSPIPGFVHNQMSLTNKQDIVRAFVNREIYVTAWNKLVRREVLTGWGFKEGIIHEDELWSFTLVNRVMSYKNIQEKTYIYYRNSNSITSHIDYNKKFNSLTIVLLEMIRLLQSGEITPYDDNFTYLKKCRINWMVTILRSQISLNEKLSLFKEYYRLPIGSKVSFLNGVLSSQINNLLYPSRRYISLRIRQILSKVRSNC